MTNIEKWRKHLKDWAASGLAGSVSKVLQKRPPESWHLEVAKPEVPR